MYNIGWRRQASWRRAPQLAVAAVATLVAVLLAALLPSPASAQSTTDDPVVAYKTASYTVGEGRYVVAAVTLSLSPSGGATIPIKVTPQGTTVGTDYTVFGLDDWSVDSSGVGTGDLIFADGETPQIFTIGGVRDTGDDANESLQLGFGALPAASSSAVKPLLR